MKKHKCNKKYLFCLLIFVIYFILLTLGTSEGHAQSEVTLAITAGGSGLIGFGLDGFQPTDGSDAVRTIRATVSEDLVNSGLFEIKTLSDSLRNLPGGSLVQWKLAGALCHITGAQSANGQTIDITVTDLRTMEETFVSGYRLDRDRLRYVAHVIADDIIGLYNNGIRGSNASMIAFVAKSGRNKELFLIDPDGQNRRQITFSRTLNMSPAFSPDGARIVYSSLTRRQWVISMINVNTGQISTISRWPGLNSAPTFSPADPDLIAFTSNRDGNTEVYTCRTRGSGLRRLTRHYAIDTSPTFSPSGNQVAFVSERAGRPKIYIMSSSGASVRRLTKTIDTYEDSPNWSPRGDRIAFVVMHGNTFDIATSDLFGEDVMILTYGSGSNENPKWSPDGLKIVFSSTRRGGKNLFIMNWDGSNVRALTTNGISSSPAWAPTSSGDDIRIPR